LIDRLTLHAEIVSVEGWVLSQAGGRAGSKAEAGAEAKAVITPPALAASVQIRAVLHEGQHTRSACATTTPGLAAHLRDEAEAKAVASWTDDRAGHGRVFLRLGDDQMEALRRRIAERGIDTTLISWGAPTLMILTLGNHAFTSPSAEVSLRACHQRAWNPPSPPETPTSR
jgi:hypothetical protein